MTTSLLHPPVTGSRTRDRLRDPVFQAFALLRIGFTVAPILFGLDKFLDWLVDWRIYLAPQIDDLIPGNAHQAMLAVGVVEIVAGLVVAVRPKWGGYLVAAWLGGIIANLLVLGDHYDVALRDFGLLLAALALARLATASERTASIGRWEHQMTRIPRHTGIVADRRSSPPLAFAACGSDPDSTASAAPATTAATHESSEHTTAPATDRIDPVDFRQEMRKLWEDHVTWTRLYIVSAVAELPDLEATAGRLLQNQADIGAAIATFYGDDAGSALTDLLRQHILIAADLVDSSQVRRRRCGDDTTAISGTPTPTRSPSSSPTANPAWPFETLSRDDAHPPRPDAGRGDRPARPQTGTPTSPPTTRSICTSWRWPTPSPTASSSSSPTASRPDAHGIRPLRRRQPRCSPSRHAPSARRSPAGPRPVGRGLSRALNAAYIAGHGFTHETLDRLADVWRRLRRHDVFPFAPHRQFLALVGARPSLCAADGLHRLVRDNLAYDRLEEAMIPIQIVATDVISGTEVALVPWRPGPGGPRVGRDPCGVPDGHHRRPSPLRRRGR